MVTRTLAVAVAATLVLVPAALAKPVAYKGKTKGGSSITFKLTGKKAKSINTVVPTICVETTGTYDSRAGAELFQPPGKFKLGKETKAKALQPAAMNAGNDATKNYTVKLGKKKKRSGKIAGKLSLNFSFIRPGLTIYDLKIFLCQGSTTFSAKPQ
jgi:hypothetical protein